jgi:hypothetical protein
MSSRGNCIKTGARVHFVEYGGVLAADLYLVDTAVVIRTNPGVPLHEVQGRATHTVLLGQEFYGNDEAGIFVVPADNIQRVE